MWKLSKKNNNFSLNFEIVHPVQKHRTNWGINAPVQLRVYKSSCKAASLCFGRCQLYLELRAFSREPFALSPVSKCGVLFEENFWRRRSSIQQKCFGSKIRITFYLQNHTIKVFRLNRM